MMTDLAKVIETIEQSSYHIPQEFFVNMSSGIPSAYIKGITNGRKQVVEILRQFETNKEGLN